MTKYLEVGRSWRTWAKHELMSSFVGQEVGATSRMRVIQRLGWIDHSAGDGAKVDGVEWHKGCSPGILAYHATRSAKPVKIVLHEIQPATYDRLVSNLGEQLPLLGYAQDGAASWHVQGRVVIQALNASGHVASVEFVRSGDAVLALNDPNAITEWAMRDSFAHEVGSRTRWFRSLSTMGCNPGGLKRLDLEERQAWFGLVDAQQAALPTYRDLLLAAIERDDAQWAYLLSTAAAWRGSTEHVVKTAFKRIGRTVAMSWFGRDREQFEETKRTLFLTKPERRELAQAQLPFGEAP